MEVRVLGPLEVRAGPRVLPIRTGRPRKLLVMLVLRLGERVSTDTLIDVLWGDDDADATAGSRVNALRILVSYLRKTLAVTDGALTIETVEGGYRLRTARDGVDAYRLEAAVSSAPQLADPQARLDVLTDALALWRGPPVPELAGEEFTQAEVQRLAELRLAAVEQRLDTLLALGRHVEAAAELQHLVVVHPLRERFYAQLMTALYRAGRQADALAVFDRARRRLVDELGLDPGPELQAVAQAVRQQSPDLQAAPAAQKPAHAPQAASPIRDREPSVADAPRPLEQLIGRDDELVRASALLGAHRLVTLIGPGGAGKSRLAMELTTPGPHDSWWVDLSPVLDRDGVIAAVATATGLSTRPVAGADAEKMIAAQLAGRDGLLVLDTCERVRADVVPLVEELLRRCPTVSILATSRQPLSAATELVWPVPPLSLPDPEVTRLDQICRSAAVRLFVERAAHRRPGFALTTENCVDVARVCLLLDGLPLAIELAAAHAAVLDVSMMVRLLDDRLRLLVDDTRQQRQHTLRATIAWSHDLLTPEEATFFARLSVFAGPFPLEAAVVVAGEGLRRDGLELLLALARHSLVTPDGAGGFRLLDTIRAFAAERLTERGPDAAATRRRHAGWYADLLTGAGAERYGVDVRGWPGHLLAAVRALPDLRQALAWCFSQGEEELGARLLSSLWWLWPREGIFEEAAQWFPLAAGVAAPGTALYADLLASSGSHAASRGDLPAAARDCGAAVKLYEQLGHRRSLARTLIALGIAQWGQGRYAAAASAHDRAGELFAEQRDTWGRALCLVLRARTAIDAGEDDALDRLDTAEAAARSSGDAHILGAALAQRALADLSAGRYDAAGMHAEQSLQLNERYGHREGVIGALHLLGLARLEQGELHTARDVLTRALRAAAPTHQSGPIAESLDCAAILAGREERWTDAARLLAAAQQMRTRSGIRRSPVTHRLAAATERTLTRHLEPAALTRARADANLLDPLEILTSL